MATLLRAAPEPAPEPILLQIRGANGLENVVVEPDDPAWLIAFHAREVESHLKQAEGDLRGKRALIEALRKERKDEAEEERKARPDKGFIAVCFERWCKASHHLRCKLTPQRFDMTAARLDEEYEPTVLVMAAVGVGANPYVIDGERKDDYKTAMQSGEQVERYANRCPREFRQDIRAEFGAGRLFEVAQ